MKTKLKLILLLIIFGYSCQKNNFDKLNEFILFNEQNIKIEDVDTQSYTVIDIKEIKSLLINSKQINESFLWKGHRLAKIKYKNGDISFLKISNYQGVFFNITENHLFQIPEKDIKLWYSILNQNTPN